MSSADAAAAATLSTAGSTAAKPAKTKKTAAASGTKGGSALKLDREPKRERFIPVTRMALLDRLSARELWPKGQAQHARRFFRYLDYWRHQQYSAALIDLDQAYEPFSPDSDLLMTRSFTDEDRRSLQQKVVEGMTTILKQANYEQIDPSDIQLIFTQDSTYGLDLHVDMDAFEEILIFYRGASNRRDHRRRLRKFMRKEEFDVPIFQRLCLLFKVKPVETRVREMMAKEKISRKEAERMVKRLRALLPVQVKDNLIYLKLFKNIPRNDLEMIFPNTQVKFRFVDKLKLGVSAGGGLGLGAFGAAGKIALIASSPIVAAGTVIGFGGVAFRQFMNFINQKQRYMVIMSQNLYFHSMADNRGVMLKLAARAAEEDVKEEMLLYSVLAKETAKHSELPEIDKAIEQYLQSSFGVQVDFDLEDALQRLIADGLVTKSADGTLITRAPLDAARHLDQKWDKFLDELPDRGFNEGEEVPTEVEVAKS